MSAVMNFTWDWHIYTPRNELPQEISIPFFFSDLRPFLNFEIWRKWKIPLKQLVSTTPLKPLNRIAWNFVVMKDIICKYAFLQEMLIWSFWGAIYIPFFVRLPVTYAWIAIHCIQHSQAMLERGVCELAHSFFHFK